MTFDELMSRAKTGDLIFFSGRKPFSWLIRIRSWSRWSHVGIVVCPEVMADVPPIEPHIIESLEGHGVRVVSFNVWRSWSGHVALGRITLPPQLREQMVDYAASKRGCRYASPWQFVRSFTLLTSRVLDFFHRREDRDRSRYFCSELAAESMKSVGCLIQKSPPKMKPADLARNRFVTLTPAVEVPA